MINQRRRYCQGGTFLPALARVLGVSVGELVTPVRRLEACASRAGPASMPVSQILHSPALPFSGFRLGHASPGVAS